MDVRYLKKFAQKTFRVRATADGEKVDKLNEKSGVPSLSLRTVSTRPAIRR